MKLIVTKFRKKVQPAFPEKTLRSDECTYVLDSKNVKTEINELRKEKMRSKFYSIST